MLYDPKWEQKTETTADPFKLPALIAWLEKQDPATEYQYVYPDECLVAQYLQASGCDDFSLDHFKLIEKFGPGINEILCGFPRTFGAALERARAIQFKSALHARRQ